MEQIAKIETLDDALRTGASFGFETAMSFAIGIVLNAVKNAKDNAEGRIGTQIAVLLHEQRETAKQEFLSSLRADQVSMQ